MTEEYQQAWLKAHRADELNAKRSELERIKRLAPFKQLVARVQSDQMKRYVYSQPLRPTQDQAIALRKLHRWRNDFMHYKPMSLSIEVRGFPQIIRLCLEVIEFLALRSGNVFAGDSALARRTQSSLQSASRHLHEIDQRYA
jgi:hypothetical protein